MQVKLTVRTPTLKWDGVNHEKVGVLEQIVKGGNGSGMARFYLNFV